MESARAQKERIIGCHSAASPEVIVLLICML